MFADAASFDRWLARWRTRLTQEPGDPTARRTAMRAMNPALIPRNHRMEAVIRAAVDRDDFAPFHEFLSVLAKPFEDQSDFAAYMRPPDEHEVVHQTFCGT